MVQKAETWHERGTKRAVEGDSLNLLLRVMQQDRPPNIKYILNHKLHRMKVATEPKICYIMQLGKSNYVHVNWNYEMYGKRTAASCMVKLFYRKVQRSPVIENRATTILMANITM